MTSQPVVFYNFGARQGQIYHNPKPQSSTSGNSPIPVGQTTTGQPLAALRTDEEQIRGGSPNNTNNARGNQDRLNQRIPDIFGKVRSIPDVLCKPYRIYKDDLPYDIHYYCVGKGSHSITDIRDHLGKVPNDTRHKYDVYGPNTSPVTSTGGIALQFVGPVPQVGNNIIEFSSPLELVPTNYIGLIPKTKGPFVFANCRGVLINVAAGWFDPSTGANMTIEVQLRQVDENNSPFGSTHTVTLTIPPNLSVPNQANMYRSLHVNSPGGWSDRIQATVRRSNAYSGAETNNAHRQGFLTGIYGNTSLPGGSHWGDVTTIRIQSPVIDSDEEIFFDQQESFDTTNSPNSTACSLTAHRTIAAGSTSRIDKIVEHLVQDPYIGNLALSAIDTAGLVAAYNDVVATFGSSIAAEFNHTFDDRNISFEETLQTVLAAGFMTASREGLQIKFHFEKDNSSPKLIFNHRNKVKGTESRAISFGYVDDVDGVSFEYTDADGAKVQFDLPNSSIVNPITDGPVGITNKLQAHFHAWRAWNKIRYQHTLCEFVATEEGKLAYPRDLVIIADNTKETDFDGEELLLCAFA